MGAGSGRQVSSAHLAVRFGFDLKRGMGDAAYFRVDPTNDD